MDNLRILEVMGEGISHGGEEAFINNLIMNIDMEGLAIDWLTPYKCHNALFESNLKNKGGKVYELGLSYAPGKNRWHLKKPMEEFFKAHHYDVVHIHSGSISALALISQAAYRHGVKTIIVHSHLASNGSIKSKMIRMAYSPYLQKYPTDYMACSIDAANAKFSSTIQRRENIRIINNGIDLTKYRQNNETREKIRKEMGIPLASRVIGHVGRFSPEKNHQFILNCFAKVYKANENAYLLLIGDGELQDKIKKMAQDLHIDDRVRFAGYVNNVPEYYKAMDLFLLPSLYEGFAIAAIEAQATGLPCVFSDKLDEKTTIHNNVYTLPITENDYECWAEVICKHLNDNPIDDQFLLHRRGFDINDTVSQIREVYLGK